MASEDRLTVAVTYDESRGYVGSAPELRQPVVALSLGGLRRKVEIAMLPDEVVVLLSLDRTARLERDRRRLTGRPRRGLAGTSPWKTHQFRISRIPPANHNGHCRTAAHRARARAIAENHHDAGDVS